MAIRHPARVRGAAFIGSCNVATAWEKAITTVERDLARLGYPLPPLFYATETLRYLPNHDLQDDAVVDGWLSLIGELARVAQPGTTGPVRSRPGLVPRSRPDRGLALHHRALPDPGLRARRRLASRPGPRSGRPHPRRSLHRDRRRQPPRGLHPRLGRGPGTHRFFLTDVGEPGAGAGVEKLSVRSASWATRVIVVVALVVGLTAAARPPLPLRRPRLRPAAPPLR